MAVICTTPVLGFDPVLADENYPYGLSGPSPQVGTLVDTIDTVTPATNVRYEFTDTDGVFSWEVVG